VCRSLRQQATTSYSMTAAAVLRVPIIAPTGHLPFYDSSGSPACANHCANRPPPIPSQQRQSCLCQSLRQQATSHSITAAAVVLHDGLSKFYHLVFKQRFYHSNRSLPCPIHTSIGSHRFIPWLGDDPFPMNGASCCAQSAVRPGSAAARCPRRSTPQQAPAQTSANHATPLTIPAHTLARRQIDTRSTRTGECSFLCSAISSSITCLSLAQHMHCWCTTM
jgi:hypothetical protein